MKKQLFITLFLLIGTSNAYTQIFSEDFNSGIHSTFTLTNADGLTPNNSTFTDAFVALQGLTGQDCAASTSWYVPAGVADDWMVTPSITLPSSTSPISLQFDALGYEAAYPDGVEIYVSTTGATPADFTGLALYNSTATGEPDVWTTRSVDLSSYAGQTIYIAFRNHSNDMNILGIDNINVDILLDDNAELVSANIDNVTAGNRTVDIIIKNIGATNITSLNLDWTFNGGATTPLNISGINLASGQSHTETVNLGTLVIGGPYQFDATVNLVNGNTDPYMANNTITTSYTIVELIPNWTMTDSYGNSVSMHSELSAGKMIVLDFFASWCGPCQSSTPELNTMYVNHTTNGMNNINVFGITIEQNDNNSVVNSLGWGGTYPKFAYSPTNDDQYDHYANTLGLNPSPGGIPFFVMICPNVNDPGNSTILQSDVGFGSGMFTASYETKFNQCPSANNTSTTVTEKEENLINTINIYPNPVNNVATLSFITNEKSNTTINITNTLGKIVYINKIPSLSAGKHIIDISTNNISEGMYFVNFITNNKIITKKITVIK